MTQGPVIYRGSRQELREIINRLPAIVAGTKPDERGVGESFRNALGFAVLGSVKESFVLKSRGGTDEMGIKWPPLSPATIANRRVGPRAGKEARERERIKKREAKKALRRYRMSLPEKEAQRRAAIVGGLKARHIMGKTKLEILGRRDVEILRDTGVLLNSLTPGDLQEGRYIPPTQEGSENQVFETISNEVVVGTNVAYAGVHRDGSRKKNIPARPFLPNEDYPVPETWWSRWLQIANNTLAVIARRLFE